MPWPFKYKPKNLAELVNQTEPVKKFLDWIKNWKPGTKGMLFHGPPGTGKTALVEAFAVEKNIDFIEMNASDYRSAKQIKEVLGKSMQQQSLFKKSKIFMIDEMDGITGREDRGGVGEIIKIIKESMYPVILTANDPWNPKLRALRNYCTLVQFKKISVLDIEKRLEQICKAERVEVDKAVLRQLSARAGGDLRSAINDLETVALGKKTIAEGDLEALGYRERETNIFDALKTIFKTQSASTARLSISAVDKDPDEIFWWIENNIAREYEDPEEIAKAFDALSKADIFKQRIMSRQDWRFKAYMIDLMTAGVAVAKKGVYRKFTKYQYPSKIITLGRTKAMRREFGELLRKLSKQLHCSTKILRRDFLPYLKIILGDKEMCDRIRLSLGLTKEEISLMK